MGKRPREIMKVAGIMLACALLMPAPVMRAQGPVAVVQLDDDQMKGVWYEIARLPNKREKSCIGDAFELDARGDKPHTLEWVDSCKTKSAYVNVYNATAKPQDKKNPSDGRLKVMKLWPFAAKYWVLALGPDYGWSLVGSPNHKSLWIYSKSPTLAPDVLAQIEAQAAAEGYPVAKLVLTPQTGQSAIMPPALMAP
jgi:apolipoprotein D and lipocalin family protein